MDAVRVGQHALLVECGGAAQVEATYAVLRARADELGAGEVVPAARTVLLDGLSDPGRALELLGSLVVPDTPPSGSTDELVELPTTYDGPDLEEVARQWQVSTAEVVRLHQSAEFTAVFCGFAPGFAYCTGLAPELGVARRAEPRPSVPAGSVALAGEYTSVYPSSSPGGWQLIGSTATPLWRPGQDRPALLAPGAKVRFVDA